MSIIDRLIGRRERALAKLVPGLLGSRLRLWFWDSLLDLATYRERLMETRMDDNGHNFVLIFEDHDDVDAVICGNCMACECCFPELCDAPCGGNKVEHQ